jgi:hypothetical protein
MASSRPKPKREGKALRRLRKNCRRLRTRVPRRSVKPTSQKRRLQSIRGVKAILGSLGFAVLSVDFSQTWGKDNERTIGGVYYKNQLVYVQHSMSLKKTLFTLLHEAGHIFAVGYGASLPNVRHRTHSKAHIRVERQAYLYGWGVARLLGLKLSKKAWRKFNWEAFVNAT